MRGGDNLSIGGDLGQAMVLNVNIVNCRRAGHDQAMACAQGGRDPLIVVRLQHLITDRRISPSAQCQQRIPSSAESMLAAFTKAGVGRNEPGFFGQPFGQFSVQQRDGVKLQDTPAG
ncbi:MAG: hypothetical protein R3A44_19250 [Caldilineaceae bacterium]